MGEDKKQEIDFYFDVAMTLVEQEFTITEIAKILNVFERSEEYLACEGFNRAIELVQSISLMKAIDSDLDIDVNFEG